MRWIAAAAAAFAVFFTIALWAIDYVWPPQAARHPPQVATPPLAPMTRTSLVIAPVAVANSAIRDALEAVAPNDLAGKRDNFLTEVLSKAEIGWTLSRAPLAIANRGDALAVTTALNGSLRLTGQFGTGVSNLGGRIAGLVGADIGQAVQNLANKAFDQRADLRGNVAVLARPVLLPAWRLEPNLTPQVVIADASLPISGNLINISKEIRPLVERAVNAQVTTLTARIRNDDAIERAARREWTRMCRSISLKNAAAGMPDLWLEMRPVRAFAAQPRVGPISLDLVLGVEADTRVIPTETKPDCPFPAELEIVPQTDRGRIAVALAIDVPFTDVSRLLQAQLAGRSFPDDGTGAVAATIETVSLAGAGDRLLLALKVNLRENGWLGIGAAADVYAWARAALDPDNQMVRFTDVTIDVESEAAFGLLGAAARAALPFLRSAIAEKAVLDLKPFAGSARRSIETAIGDFTRQEPGVRVNAGVSALRLTGIVHDATTLRLIAEANGAVGIEVTALPK
jgi:Domain of unknown function (DUF4403)